MSPRVPPTAPEAEQAVIGASLYSVPALNDAMETHGVHYGDFHAMKHQLIWAAIASLYADGDAVDVVTVLERLRAQGSEDASGGLEYLNQLMNATPATSNMEHYAEAIKRAGYRRRLIGAGAEISDLGYDQPDVETSIIDAENILLRVQHHAESLTGRIEGYYDDVTDMIGDDEEDDDIVRWVIPGLLRVRERLLIVAGPGTGKSVLLRQLAYCAANGVHPWNGKLSTVREQRVLIVELEASPHNVKRSALRIRRNVADILGADGPQELQKVPILTRPSGLDIRDPADRSSLIEAIRRTRPDLVCIGPLKYMYSSAKGETFDETAVAAQRLLNTLMVRYDFAIAIEAHTNRSDAKRPSGSERWVDWPDVGFVISTDRSDPDPIGEPAPYNVTQFRFPRNDDVILPTELMRNHHVIPWKASQGPTGFFESYMPRWSLDPRLPFRRNSAPAKVGAYMRDPEEER